MTNSDFSFHCLDILVKSNHKILSVVTNPPEEIGRQKKNTNNIITLKCEELGINTIEQKDLNDIRFKKNVIKNKNHNSYNKKKCKCCHICGVKTNIGVFVK